MAVHVVNIGLVMVLPNGQVKTKDQMTIGEILQASSDFRVLPNVNVPNSLDYPTLEEYLNDEAGGGFAPVSVTQTTVITGS